MGVIVPDARPYCLPSLGDFQRTRQQRNVTERRKHDDVEPLLTHRKI